MELIDVIQRRQSIRRFTGQTVPTGDLEKILDAARRAPSGENLQNWHFVVVRDAALKARIRDAIREKNETLAARVEEKDFERAARFRKMARHFTLFFVDAPVLIVTYSYAITPHAVAIYRLAEYPEADVEAVCACSPGMQGVGAAMENMSLRAVELGYGTCWITSANYAAKEIAEVLRQEASFEKEGYSVVNMLALGVPQPDQKSPERKPLSDIVTYL